MRKGSIANIHSKPAASTLLVVVEAKGGGAKRTKKANTICNTVCHCQFPSSIDPPLLRQRSCLPRHGLFLCGALFGRVVVVLVVAVGQRTLGALSLLLCRSSKSILQRHVLDSLDENVGPLRVFVL